MPNLIIPNSEMVWMLTAEFLTPAEVAALLKVPRKAVADMRLKRQGPPFILQKRGIVVYPAESIRWWLRAQENGGEGREARESRSRRVARLRTMQAPAVRLQAGG